MSPILRQLVTLGISAVLGVAALALVPSVEASDPALGIDLAPGWSGWLVLLLGVPLAGGLVAWMSARTAVRYTLKRMP